MKNLNTIFFALLSFIFVNIGYTQKGNLEYLKLIGDHDPIFESDTFPSNWKNESAIILADKITCDLYEATPLIGYRQQHRTKILLLDAAAVEAFSVFYFDEKMNTKIKEEIGLYKFDSLQILVKKVNGSSILIDLKSAIKEEKTVNIPELYRKRFVKTSSYYKIAIPNLEPGDIVDFYTMSRILFHIDYVRNSFSFPEIDYTLDNTYHTVKHKLVVKSPTIAKANKYGFNMLYINTYNGAPAIKQENINNTMVCSLEANLLPKNNYERWQYPFLSVPSVKGYLTYVNASPKNLLMYKQYPNAIPFGRTSIVNIDHILTTMNFNTQYSIYIWYSDVKNTVNQSNDGREVLAYLREYHPKVFDPIEIAKLAFYYLRSKSFNEKWNYDNENFIGLMKEVLNAYSIKHTHLVTVPRSHSTLENILLRDDLHVLLKIIIEDQWDKSVPNKFIYLSNVNDHLNFGELETQYQGAEAYEYIKTPPAIRKVIIPVISPLENALLEKMSCTVSSDLEIVSIENQTTIKGSEKKGYNDSLSFRNEYKAPDIIAYKYPEYSVKTDSLKEKEIRHSNQLNRIIFRKNEVSRSLSLISYDEFKLIQDGRVFDKQEIVFEEKYKVKDLISVAGTKHLFSVGKLIGQQLEIKESEMNRKTDIYMNAARQFQYDITVILPIGYTIQNIDKLNINVSNETGTFQSIAKLENNKLTIIVSKIYNHNTEKKEDWSKMIAFIDACYDFTQTKVFLIKK